MFTHRSLTSLAALIALMGLPGCVVHGPRVRSYGHAHVDVVTYPHGHYRHVCDTHCGHYHGRSAAVVVYRHGHPRHVCDHGCGHWHPARRVVVTPPRPRATVVVYPHGHRLHVCGGGCSHPRIRLWR